VRKSFDTAPKPAGSSILRRVSNPFSSAEESTLEVLATLSHPASKPTENGEEIVNGAAAVTDAAGAAQVGNVAKTNGGRR
jgi:hypothetical protein